MEKRAAALHALNAIAQATAVETDLASLYPIIDQETRRVIGEVYFMIALYDRDTNRVEIPYAQEGHKLLHIDAFPLGEGLTSIVIQTGKPLLLQEDTEFKAQKMGVRIAGVPAQSWLGVPLTVGEETIGAIIVQDVEVEWRFTEDDQRLLSTLASQVAVAIRNVQLRETARRQAERERLVFEITEKIRRAVDIQSVMKTTATELGKALGARLTTIEIKLTNPALSPKAVIGENNGNGTSG